MYLSFLQYALKFTTHKMYTGTIDPNNQCCGSAFILQLQYCQILPAGSESAFRMRIRIQAAIWMRIRIHNTAYN